MTTASDRLAGVFTEISTFDQLAELLRLERVASKRREKIEEFLDSHPGYQLTDILLLEPGIQSEILAVINGIVVEGGRPRQDVGLIRPERFHFRTTNGEPAGKVKVGIDSTKRLTVREQRSLARVGRDHLKYRELGATFELTAQEAVTVLRQQGYGFPSPRYANRNATLTGEKDCRGQAVKPRDRWLVVEVGSVFEQQAQEAGELKPIKSAAEPRRRAAGE